MRHTKNFILVTAALVTPLILNIAPSNADVPTQCAAAIPAGFDWPADPVSLYRISGGITSGTLNIPGTIDLANQRKHGWLLFAGVTQPANAEAHARPVFHTWYTVEEAFDSTPSKIDCSKRQMVLQLTLPTQLAMVAPNPVRDLVQKEGLNPPPRFDPNFSQIGIANVTTALSAAHDGVVAFSHVAFNQEMYDWIRDNQYYSKPSLGQLIDLSVARKRIVDPPVRGISLKFSWWPVAPDNFTPVPVWDSDPRFPGDAKNPPTSWKRVVVVDPIGGQPPPAKVTLGGFDHLNPKVVTLDKFYTAQITQEEAALANADFRIKQAAIDVLGRPLQEHDYIVMTAMHIATREFDPWVFSTFWWSDDPQGNPLGKDMDPKVDGVFRNYVMDISYNINAPKTADGKAPIAFNPWLELFQLGGTRSQCMACHARAAFGPKVLASFNPATMDTLDPNGFNASPQGDHDPNFAQGTLDLHRVWTIFTRAQ